jgi:formiminotetrahydrofolate cyclodeaminase
MNLTNYKKTPVHRVVEMIRREAAQYGAQITHSELIGLIPEKALIDASVEDSNSDFLENLAAGTATPGGGSAAAFNGAMAAALVAMVAKLTVKNKKYETVKAEMEKIAEEADKLRGELTLAVKKDSDAFEEVMAAYKLPKVTDEDKQIRKEKIQDAFLNASHVPLEVVKLCVQVMVQAVAVAEKGNSNAITDVGTAFANAVSGVTGAAMNVRINLGSLKDEGQVNSIKEELHNYESEVKELRKKIMKAVEENGKTPFSKI